MQRFPGPGALRRVLAVTSRVPTHIRGIRMCPCNQRFSAKAAILHRTMGSMNTQMGRAMQEVMGLMPMAPSLIRSTTFFINHRVY